MHTHKRMRTHIHTHIEYNPGPSDANIGLPRASLVFAAVAFASLSVAVVMLPTQVMINGAFSWSAFHRAEQGAEDSLERPQLQPQLAWSATGSIPQPSTVLLAALRLEGEGERSVRGLMPFVSVGGYLQREARLRARSCVCYGGRGCMLWRSEYLNLLIVCRE